MTSADAAIATIEKLSSSWDSTADEKVFRQRLDDETFIGITIVSHDGAASFSFWANEYVGGLLDVEVIDGDSKQVLWRHLEGPAVADIERAWNEMLGTYLKLRRPNSGDSADRG